MGSGGHSPPDPSPPIGDRLYLYMSCVDGKLVLNIPSESLKRLEERPPISAKDLPFVA